ncbi:DUF72 domain-containing protein [Uliginosibacterium sp. H1]|uniref:DUF72 domain-containing protein n=1 Tax=Uliginosibacterium sp. H1 TaxID=3114757 RepID=UPI002E16BD5E|nr:DUF72 domain-containing protein [Uliginosibacterium sp. H1]
MRTLVGTASWTDPTLIACQRFYPRGTHSAEDRLRYYASQFPLVEVDASYYSLPSPANAQLWVARTPADFTFNVKAFGLFTGHPVEAKRLPRDLLSAWRPAQAKVFYRDVPGELRDELWRRWHLALQPLRDAGKLGAVLCQYPPWVTADRNGHLWVHHGAAHMCGDTMAVEFRHRSWFDGAQADSTLAFLRERQLVHVIADEPQGFDNSVPQVWEVTHPRLAMLRMHGRNTATWNHSGPASSGRFVYQYSAAELEDLARKVQRLRDRTGLMHVVVNTNHEDDGQRNARHLIPLLAGGA